MDKCSHPEDKRKNWGNATKYGFRCLECKESVTEGEGKRPNGTTGSPPLPLLKKEVKKSRTPRPGYVYVMRGNAKDRVKVGRCGVRNLQSRLDTHCTSDPDCHYVVVMYTTDQVRCEREVHLLLDESRISHDGPGNEWFRCAADEADRALHEVILSVALAKGKETEE